MGKPTEEMIQEKVAFMDVAEGKVDGFTFRYRTIDEAVKAAHRLSEYRSRNKKLEGVIETQIIRRKNVLHLMHIEKAIEFDKKELDTKHRVRKTYLHDYYIKRKSEGSR